MEEKNSDTLDLIMLLNMGEGKIYFTVKNYKKSTAISYLIENNKEAFEENVDLIEFPLHISFASRGFFKNFKILNVY